MRFMVSPEAPCLSLTSVKGLLLTLFIALAIALAFLAAVAL